MGKRLSLKSKEDFINIPEDTVISVEDVNPLFNDYSSFSFDFELPLDLNRHVLKDIGIVKSDARLNRLEGEHVTIVVDGIPFREGTLNVTEVENIENSIPVNIKQIGLPIKDVVAGLSCRDIPVKDKIQIGRMLGDFTVSADYEWSVNLDLKSTVPWAGDLILRSERQTGNFTKTFQPFALGFSAPKIYKNGGTSSDVVTDASGEPLVETTFVNVSDAYPDKFYCNARVCYTHYKKDDSGDGASDVSTDEPGDPYYVLPADRPQSGICFYVLYFLDCLFHYLGIHYDKSGLLSVGDMKRLAFFTTHCKYDVEERAFHVSGINRINDWLSNRKMNGRVEFKSEGDKSIDSISDGTNTYNVNSDIALGLSTFKVRGIKVHRESSNVNVVAKELDMYANSQNFPDMTVTSLMESLWGSFGIRFLVDESSRIVRPVFIRDIFRDSSDPISINAKLVRAVVVNERIDGVRMTYAAESDKKKQRDNITIGATDYDTDYDYIDYRVVDVTKDYDMILRERGVADTTCYIDVNTGNAYRLKISDDAKDTTEKKPVLFEVGGYKGVEIGDCREENEDFIVEIASEFEPVQFNDVNTSNSQNKTSNLFPYPIIVIGEGFSLNVSGINTGYREQILAAYVDEKMKYQNTEFILSNIISEGMYEASLDFHVSTDESYDPSETESGNSPLQEVDWGNAIAIMRGGGSDSRIEYYDEDYDGMGGTKWRTVSSKYGMSSDSIDNWGNDYDYNSTSSGIGGGERFSLKIRAFKVVDGKIQCNDDERDENGEITRKIRSRGLFDTFMSEYSFFLMNRKKYEISFQCNVSELLNIQWDKRYRIGDYIFWWNKLSYPISAKNGIGLVTAEIYTL